MNNHPLAEDSAADAARIELAAQMRRGMHLLVGRAPSTDEMSRLAALLSTELDQLEESSARQRGQMEVPAKLSVPADGEPFPNSLDRPISGSGNPFSIPMTMSRDGDAVVSTVTLDAGFEGAPGRSHGGVVAAIFDDLFGSVPMLDGKIAFTASITVNYVAPSPVREPVSFRAWLDRVEGKKLYIVGEAHHGETLVTTASSLFIDATELLADLYGS